MSKISKHISNSKWYGKYQRISNRENKWLWQIMKEKSDREDDKIVD